MVHMQVRLRIGTLEGINPDLFGAHPDQFQNGCTMKRITESVAVGKQKVSTEYEIEAVILEGQPRQFGVDILVPLTPSLVVRFEPTQGHGSMFSQRVDRRIKLPFEEMGDTGDSFNHMLDIGFIPLD
jgi:hypothetical protein